MAPKNNFLYHFEFKKYSKLGKLYFLISLYIMLVLFICLSLSSDIWKFIPINLNDDAVSRMMVTINNNMNDFVNDGLNISTFLEPFNDIPYFSLKYDDLINSLTNQTLQLPNKLDNISPINILPFLDLSKTLHNISPEIKEWLLNNAEQLKNFKPILFEIGPHICKTLNLDFDIINKLYDYVFINAENDGVSILNIYKILQIPTDLIPQLRNAILFFDGKATISDLFSALNALPQYFNFVDKVKLLRIPYNGNAKFFSIIRIIDCISSAIDVLDAVIQNFLIKFSNDLASPLLTKYLLKPFNFFEVPLSERAIELRKAIDIVHYYSFHCKSKDDELKCNVNKYVESILGLFLCQMKMFNVCLDRPDTLFEKAKGIVSVFSFFSSFPLDMKIYLNLLQGFNYINSNDVKLTFSNYQVSYQEILTNLVNLYSFLDNIDDSSNFKYVFDFLNINNIWQKLEGILEKIGDNKSLGDLIGLSDEQCTGLLQNIVGISKIFVSTDPIEKVFPEKVVDDIAEKVIPALKSLSLSFSQFMFEVYKQIIGPENVKTEVDFTKLVRTMGSYFDKILTVIEKMVPISTLQSLQVDPNIVYNLFKESHEAFNIMKNNGKVDSFLYRQLGSSSVILEMIINGANGYVNGNTTMETITRSIQPTYFLNIYETFHKLSQLDSLDVLKLTDAISFDTNSSKFSINDLFPIKFLVMNSKMMADEMKNEVLHIDTIASFLGIRKEKLYQFIFLQLKPSVFGSIIGSTIGITIPKTNA